jgi:hypothetical protein
MHTKRVLGLAVAVSAVVTLALAPAAPGGQGSPRPGGD